MSDARTEIFRRIRAGLDAAPTEVTRRAPNPRVGLEPQGVPRGDRETWAADFAAAHARLAGTCLRVADAPAAAEALAGVLAADPERAAAGLGVSDDLLCQRVAALVADRVQVVGAGPDAAHMGTAPLDTATLLELGFGLTSAQAGIAATGTLVLDHASEAHRRLSLVPPHHVCLLPTDRLRPDLGQAFAHLGTRRESHLLTFVTGCSRTGDIELQLVLGAHGPERLTVILVDAP